MAEIDPDLMRVPETRRAFWALMWAYLLFLYLPFAVPRTELIVELLPDPIGWLIALLALGWIVERHPDARPLRILAGAGLFVSLATVVRLPSSGTGMQSAYLGLYTAGALIGVSFTWRLCGLVARMGKSAGSRRLRRKALLRRWLYVVCAFLPLSLLVIPRVELPGLAPVVVILLPLLFSAIIISLMMGLMADAARLCQVEGMPAGPGGQDEES